MKDLHFRYFEDKDWEVHQEVEYSRNSKGILYPNYKFIRYESIHNGKRYEWIKTYQDPFVWNYFVDSRFIAALKETKKHGIDVKELKTIQ